MLNIFFNRSPTDLLLELQSCIYMFSKIEELKTKQVYARGRKYKHWRAKEYEFSSHLCFHSFDFFLFFCYVILEMFKLRCDENK